MVHTPGGRGARTERRSYLAAPPLLDDGEPEGSAVFREVPSPAGLLLHAALRDLMLWIETPPTERASLFPGEACRSRTAEIERAEPDEALWAPLLALAALTGDPTATDDRRVLHATRRIAAWAEARGHLRTQLAFAQASALLRPSDPAFALEVGRLARDTGQHARGESWFRYAVRIARQRDWRAYVWAYVGLGVLYLRAGNGPAAEVVTTRALRSARRRNLGELEAVAHHHLFHIRADAGRIADAYQHARQALEAYGTSHPRLPALAHDLGRFWIHVGEFARAHEVIDAIRNLIDDEGERVVVIANLARAAAGAGDREAYERARNQAVDLFQSVSRRHRLPDAYEAIAHGDLSMEEWERAEAAAKAALKLAHAQRNAAAQIAAEVQLERARNRRAAASAPDTAALKAGGRRADHLAGDIIRVLVAAPPQSTGLPA